MYNTNLELINCAVIEDDKSEADKLHRYFENFPEFDLAVQAQSPASSDFYSPGKKVELIFCSYKFKDQLYKKLEKDEIENIKKIFMIGADDTPSLLNDETIVDMLVYPLTYPPFVKSIIKSKEALSQSRADVHINQFTPETVNFIFLKSGSVTHKVDINDIPYMKKEGHYFKIFLENKGKILIRSSFAEITQRLPADLFVRVHKSYILNIKHIDVIESEYVNLKGEKIPLSPNFKNSLLEHINLLNERNINFYKNSLLP